MSELKDYAGSVAVVVSSCDAFFDAWRPFTFFFRKFWSDCPFPIHLIVNRLRVHSNLIHPVAVGPDRGWATNMQIALQEIKESHILYMQEDYFLKAPVDRAQLAEDFAYSFAHNAASFCFYGRSQLEADFRPINQRYGVVPRDSDGRTRCQVTLWKRDVFASALRSGETAWNMEARGSERTRDNLTISYARPDSGAIPYLMSGISRGLWMPQAIALCREHNLEIQPKFRPNFVENPSARKFRRAIGRVRFPFSYARQLMQPIDLDAAD